MDIEGDETLVLADLVKTNRLSIPKEFIIEYHHNIQDKPDFASFLNHFEQAGFSYNLKTNYNNPGDFQDIVIHFYKKEQINKIQ